MKRFKYLFIMALSALFTFLVTFAAHAAVRPNCVYNLYKPETPEHLKR